MHWVPVLTTQQSLLQSAVTSTTTVTIAGAVSILVLLALSAFFSSSEIAMFSLPAHKVDNLVENGVPGAATLKALKDDPHRLLVTILVGNNIVNIAMSSIATGLLAFYVTQGQSVVIATVGITMLVLLFGEAAPKSYAVENTESWALTIARPLKLSEYFLLPMVVSVDYLTRILNRVTGGRSTIESTYVTRSEIKDMIETGERAGVLEEDEHEMLQRIFRFNNTIAKEVMTPRLDMTAVSVDASVDEALTTCVQSGHARVPVYEGSLDNVIGVVHIRDLVRDTQYGENDVDVRDLINPTLHVPESKNADELLSEMRDERVHMVVVIDEFGNAITNVPGDLLDGRDRIQIDGTVWPVADHYAAVDAGDGLVTVGSHGNVELAVNQGRGADRFDVAVGDAVALRFD